MLLQLLLNNLIATKCNPNSTHSQIVGSEMQFFFMLLCSNVAVTLQIGLFYQTLGVVGSDIETGNK